MSDIWEIMDKALDRHGYVGMFEEGELSIRLYDENLKQNLDADMSYDPEPFEQDHPFFHDYWVTVQLVAQGALQRCPAAV